MTDHRKYFKEVASFRAKMRQDLNTKRSELEKIEKDERYSKQYVRQQREFVKAFERGINDSVRDEAKRQRDLYLSSLQYDYLPTRARVSENIRLALDSGITFTPSEYELLMRDAKSDFDRRLIAETAARNGITVTGFISLDERLRRFDEYCDLLTSEPSGEWAEIAPRESMRLQLQRAEELYNGCEDMPEVHAYRTPTTFTEVGAAIDAERSAKTAEKASQEETDAFMSAAEIDDTASTDARSEVAQLTAKARAEKALEKFREEKARKQIEAMTEGLDNCAYEAAMKEIEARTAEETTAASTTD